jgi:hypothetical protein
MQPVLHMRACASWIMHCSMHKMALLHSPSSLHLHSARHLSSVSRGGFLASRSWSRRHHHRNIRVCSLRVQADAGTVISEPTQVQSILAPAFAMSGFFFFGVVTFSASMLGLLWCDRHCCRFDVIGRSRVCGWSFRATADVSRWQK